MWGQVRAIISVLNVEMCFVLLTDGYESSMFLRDGAYSKNPIAKVVFMFDKKKQKTKKNLSGFESGI